MFNKRLIILMLLAIFCIGITINSVSAINIDVNNTDSNLNFSQFNEENKLDEINLDEDIISQSNSDKIASGHILKIDTENYDKFDNTEELSVSFTSDGGARAYYNVFDSNGNLKYNQEHIETVSHQWASGHFIFESNHNVFKNLPDGVYLCCLSESKILDVDSISTKGKIIWNVTKITPEIEPQTTDFPTNNYIPTTKSSTSSHYTKYIKVGKYKVPVWSDDSLNTQKKKVIKYLNSHVKKAHKFKIHGYKFKVSAKMYRKILYYKKYGYDGKMGYSNFKVKTNKYKKYKEPIYKTKKVTKKVWVYKKVLSSWARWGDDWYDDEYYSLTKYFKNGWEAYGYFDREYSQGADHYVKIKKKVKKTIIKKKIVGYKKVKVKVYAYGVQSKFKVGVQFWGLKNGKKYCPITNYYMF